MTVADSSRHTTGPIRTFVERYGYIFAVLCIIVSTAVFFPMRAYFAKGQWALLYLLLIGFIAGVSGVRPALLAAGLAFLSWNYFFLPPYHTFYIADPKDWLSLFAFLIVGVAMGVQTGRMREREAEALARERETALLNRFSGYLVSDRSIPDMADVLVAEITGVVGSACAVLFLPDRSGNLQPVRPTTGVFREPEPEVLAFVEWVYRESKAVGLPQVKDTSELCGEWPITVEHGYTQLPGARGDVFLPLMSTSRQEGVLHVGAERDGKPYALHDARLLVAIANQVAAFIERKRLQSLAVQADALQEADRLKSTLISSVSHELKTPLASVTATVSSLLEGDVEWDEKVVHAELQALGEDLDRLNTSIGSLLDLSRLESDAWAPRKDWYEFGEILATALTKIPQKPRGRISFDVPEDLPPLFADFDQWVKVLQNLLENALAYSGSDTPVRVGVKTGDGDTRIWVEDEGPGVRAEERERIFEKFFRGESGARVPSGTGLGLAITREIVRFHGGKIWVEDVVPHGARFMISLPNKVAAEEGD